MKGLAMDVEDLSALLVGLDERNLVQRRPNTRPRTSRRRRAPLASVLDDKAKAHADGRRRRGPVRAFCARRAAAPHAPLDQEARCRAHRGQSAGARHVPESCLAFTGEYTELEACPAEVTKKGTRKGQVCGEERYYSNSSINKRAFFTIDVVAVFTPSPPTRRPPARWKSKRAPAPGPQPERRKSPKS